MELVSRVIAYCGIALFDPVMAAEVSLRLALLMESMSTLLAVDAKCYATLFNDYLIQSPTDGLIKALQVLTYGLANMSKSREFSLQVDKGDGQGLADVIWMKVIYGQILFCINQFNLW